MSELLTNITKGGLHLDTVYELLKRVNDYGGFMTGSAIIGGFRNTSDIDIAFPVNSAEAVDNILQKNHKDLGFTMKYSDYNRGYKLEQLGSVTLNVVELHPYDYCAWLFATNFLKKQHVILDKCTRHRAFELAVTLFKLANSGSNYVTIEGAKIYYQDHHAYTLTNEFEEFAKQQIEQSDLPF